MRSIDFGSPMPRANPALSVVAVCVAALSVAPCAAAPPATVPAEGLRDRTPRAYALCGAKVVVRPGRVLDEATVLIRDGIVLAVNGDVEPPADARRVDLAGRVLYPGFIDTFGETNVSRSSVQNGAAYWNDEITPQRDVGQSFEPDDDLNKTLRSQGIAARLVAPSGGVIKGTGALVLTGEAAAAKSILSSRVAMHVRLTVPFRWGSDYPSSPMGAVALARQAFYDASWYREAWAAHRANRLLPRPEQNEALEILGEYAGGEKLVIADAPNEMYALRAHEFASEFNLRVVLRGSGNEYRRLEAIRETGRAVIVPVDFPKPPDVSTPESAAAARLDHLMHWYLAPENPGRVARAGIPMALTTHGLKKADEFLSAVRKAVDRGLDPDDALSALTTTPARLLGVDDQLGSIEPGKTANLIVANGDLFDKNTKISSVWVDGHEFHVQRLPTVDVRGTWHVEIADRSHGVNNLTLTISGEPTKLKATIKPADEPQDRSVDDSSSGAPTTDRSSQETDATGSNAGSQEQENAELSEDGESKQPPPSKAKRIEFAHGRLTASFDASVFDTEGIAQLTVLVTTNGAETLSGYLQLPSGDRFNLEAYRQDAAGQADDSRAADTEPDEAGCDNDDETDCDKDKAGSDADRADNSDKTADRDASTETDSTNDDDPNKTTAEEPLEVAVNYPLGAFGRRSPPDVHGTVAFRGATVWTCGDEGTIENGCVIIRDGRIAAIGACDQLDIPENAIVMDADGKHLTPGIIDCHSHMATDGGLNESGQAITAEVRVADFIDPDDINIYRQLAGGVTAANILHGSANPIGGQNQVIKLRWGATAQELKMAEAPPGIKFALGENVKQSNWGDRYTSRYPQTRMGVEQIVLDEFHAAQDYRRRHDAWRRTHQGLPPRRDLQSEAIAEVLQGKRWIHCHSYRQDEILALLRLLERFNVKIGTLQHVLEGYKVAPEMAQHGAMGSTFSDWWAYKFEVYDAIPYNGALMHDAGIVVSFNSDNQELARHLNHEAAKAVKYGGISPEEALQFVTLNPARQLRIDQFVGSLEVGKHADLVVWSGSPLSTLSRCEQTWIDGCRYFDVELDRQLRDEAEELHARLVQKALASGEKMADSDEEMMDISETYPREDIFCGHGHGGQ